MFCWVIGPCRGHSGIGTPKRHPSVSRSLAAISCSGGNALWTFFFHWARFCAKLNQSISEIPAGRRQEFTHCACLNGHLCLALAPSIYPKRTCLCGCSVHIPATCPNHIRVARLTSASEVRIVLGALGRHVSRCLQSANNLTLNTLRIWRN